MPMAMPTMAPSASGVSMTRCSPNFLSSPSVTRKTPSSTPTSSPRTITSSSRSISWWSARLMALTIVSFRISLGCAAAAITGSSVWLGLPRLLEVACQLGALRLEVRRPLGVDVVEDVQQLRLHPGLGPLDRLADLGVDLRFQGGVGRLVEQTLPLEVAPEARERLLRLPRPHFLLAPVLRG